MSWANTSGPSVKAEPGTTPTVEDIVGARPQAGGNLSAALAIASAMATAAAAASGQFERAAHDHAQEAAWDAAMWKAAQTAEAEKQALLQKVCIFYH